MIHVFYDFETSSLSLSGQIISYCFWAVTQDGHVVADLSGTVSLNRCELPDLDALLITQLSIDYLTSQGSPEPIVATTIYTFLFRLIETHGKVMLCGYNSNQFDLKFLRSLLIRHGLNPYFYGKLEYRDVLHWVRYLAMTHAGFPMNCHHDGYWTFSLERMAHTHHLSHSPQTHDAIDDVKLTIELVKTLESTYHTPFLTYPTIQHPPMNSIWMKNGIASPPNRVESTPLFPLLSQQNTLLLLQLNRIPIPLPDTLAECRPFIESINTKTGFLWATLAPTAIQTDYAPILQTVASHRLLSQLDVPSFFSMSSPTDIELRITMLPFSEINTLRHFIEQCHQNWESAPQLLRSIHHQSPDNHHLTQLAHRYYFNHAPTINEQHLQRYLSYRHLNGGVDPIRTRQSLEASISKARGLESDPTQPLLARQIATGYLARANLMFDLN